MTYVYHFCWMLNVSWIDILNNDKDFSINILFFSLYPPSPFTSSRRTQSPYHWKLSLPFSMKAKFSQFRISFLLAVCISASMNYLLGLEGLNFMNKTCCLLKQAQNLLKFWCFLNFIFLSSKQELIDFSSSFRLFRALSHSHSPALVVGIMLGLLPPLAFMQNLKPNVLCLWETLWGFNMKVADKV